MRSSLRTTSVADAHAMTAPRVVRSELDKLRSLRSPRWLLFAIVLTPISLGMARAAVALPAWEADPVAGVSAALEAVAVGALPAAFLSAALGLVVMGSEYTDDALSSTLIAVPRRRLVVVAKCVPVFVLAFTATAIGMLGAGVLAALILQGRAYDGLPLAPLAEIAALGALGSALVGVLGVAATALVRSVVAAALQLAVVLALAPPAIGIVGGANARWLTDLLPATAVQAMVTRSPGAPFTLEGAPPSSLPWWGALLLLMLWVGTYLLLALSRVARRTAPQPPPSRGRRTRPSPRRRPHSRAGLTARAILESEVFRFATLPSTRWLLAMTMFVIVAVAVLQASTVSASDILSDSGQDGDLALITSAHQAQTVASGIGLAQILFALLGVIAITSEFTSGSIRPALIAAPQRLVVLSAKVIVVVSTAALAAGISHLIAALLVTPIMKGRGFEAGVFTPVLTETVLRCTAACALVAMIGCAIGALLRSPIASICAIVAVFILSHTVFGPLQVLSRGTPLVWLANLDELFPTATIAVQIVPPNAYWPQFLVGEVLQFNPGQSMGMLAVWAILLTTLAFVGFRRRGL